MGTSRANASIELTLSAVTIAGYRLAAPRLSVAVEFERSEGGRLLRDCLIDTGAPVCVIPFSIHDAHDIVWEQVSDSARTPTATWFETPCDLGRVRVWLPAPDGTALGPFSLIAKFPRASPQIFQKQRTPVPVLLGLNFFADTRTQVQFQCYQGPDAGTIDFP
jgi:hypothetical protein